MVTERMVEAAADAMVRMDRPGADDLPGLALQVFRYKHLARAALEAAEAAAWEVMETAPRDREVWYYAPPSDELPSLLGRVKYHPDAGFCVDEFREPTHWRPLPTPPEISDE